jgi:hypothetical protein
MFGPIPLENLESNEQALLWRAASAKVWVLWAVELLVKGWGS